MNFINLTLGDTKMMINLDHVIDIIKTNDKAIIKLTDGKIIDFPVECYETLENTVVMAMNIQYPHLEQMKQD